MLYGTAPSYSRTRLSSFVRSLKFFLRHPLVKGEYPSAIGRIIRWQVASRILPAPVVVPFLKRSKLILEKGSTVAIGNWYFHLYEVEEMLFVLHILRSEDSFLDVGANIGSFSVAAAAIAGSSVVAIEPIPATFFRLAENVGLNCLADKVQIMNVGLATEDGELIFSSSMGAANRVLSTGTGGEFLAVQVAKLDNIVNQGRCPIVIKIDAEGYELPILRGACKTLTDRALKCVIVESNDNCNRYNYSRSDLITFMSSFGFHQHSYDPFQRELQEFKDDSENILFARDLDEIAERVKNAPYTEVGTRLI